MLSLGVGVDTLLSCCWVEDERRANLEECDADAAGDG